MSRATATARRNASSAGLDHLRLRPDARRRGIGGRLPAQGRGAAEGALTLYVFQRDTAARAFHERHGFTAVAFDDGACEEENEPDVLHRWVPGRP